MGTIHIEMLGHLRILEPETGVDETINVAGRGRQIWELIIYLILHRNRGITAQELIDKLCPELDSDNPNDTLKNRVSRARSTLDRLGLSDARNLIRCTNGLYRWAPGRETVLDLDEFERLAAVEGLDPTAAAERGLQAIRLYRGDFVPALAYNTWTAPLSAYYHTTLVKLALRSLKQLYELNRWDDVEELAHRAFELDLSVEEFSIHLMRAFTENGLAQKALDHFAYVRQSMMEQYGVTPSAELELARTEALKRLYGGRLTKPELQAFLSERDTDGAFCCDCATFREVVWVNARHMARSKSSSQLLVITLETGEDSEKLAIQMKRMETVVSRTLRVGDSFTKLSACRILALLPGAAPENGSAVVDRLSAGFRRMYPRSGGNFQYDLYDLTTLIA